LEVTSLALRESLLCSLPYACRSSLHLMFHSPVLLI